MTDIQAALAMFVPYGQGKARGLDDAELGTHGVEVDRLVALGLPVVPGLTLPVSQAELLTDPAVARAAVDLLQQLAGRRFDDPNHSLLIRLVAGTSAAGGSITAADLPGLGITAESCRRLDELVGGGAVPDVFAAVIRYLGEHAGDVPADDFADAEYGTTTPAERVTAFLELSAAAGFTFPEDPGEQLACAARAIRHRWSSPRMRRQRRGQGLPDDLGIAFHVQAVRIGPPAVCGHGARHQPRPGHAASSPPTAASAAGCARPRPTTAPASRSTRCPAAATC